MTPPTIRIVDSTDRITCYLEQDGQAPVFLGSINKTLHQNTHKTFLTDMLNAANTWHKYKFGA